MNIMGMGMMELAVVLLVAFLVLGPGRSIDMARRTGKVLGDLRRTFSEVTDAISMEERQEERQRTHVERPSPGVPSRPETPDDEPYTQDADASGEEASPSRNEANGRG